MKYITIALREDSCSPIAASEDWKTLVGILDDYFGPDGKQLAWHVNNAKYPDSYVGYFDYSEDGYVIKVKIYDVEVDT